MTCNIMVVEDEIFVATEIEYMVSDLGHKPIGIAADKQAALKMAAQAEVAFVDLNLRDGPTGQEIGRFLADAGVTVVFMTANPSQLGSGVPGTIGVISKPLAEDELRQAVSYAVATHNCIPAAAPARMLLF